MRQILITIILITKVYSSIAQELLLRTIDWSIKNIENNNFLWFENAIYQDPSTMAPYYFELIELDKLNIVDVNELSLINEKWEPINELEKTKINNINLLENKIINYSITKERGKRFLQITIPAIRNIDNHLEKLVSFTLSISQKSTSPIKIFNNSSKTQSVLSSGKWIKVSVENSGIHKITYSELKSYGLSNLSNISVWGNGGKKLPYMNSEPSSTDILPIPIYIEKGIDGVFNEGDYILFYAEGSRTLSYNTSYSMWSIEQHPYSNKIHYFLTTSQAQLLIETTPSASGATTNSVNTYDVVLTFEQNDTNLVKSGREWFGESFDITTTRLYNANLFNP